MVPRIAAPTILENRELRREQLTKAALELALEGGAEAITVTAVAKRAGLSRAAIYEYFASSADLIADLILDEMEFYTARLESAVDTSAEPFIQIEQWIGAALTYIADGRHLLVKSLNAISTPEFRKVEIAMGHKKMMSSIFMPMKQIGFKDTFAAITYLQSVIDNAANRIDAGNEKELEIQNAIKFASAGLRALAIN